MKYYILYPNRQVEFANYTQLVNYLLKPSSRPYGKDKYNNNNDPILDRVQITGNDTRRAVISTSWKYFPSLGSYPVPEYGYILRDTKIVDEFGNNAFNSQLIDDLKKYQFREDIDHEWQIYSNHNKPKHWYTRWDFPPVEFRKEPVPFTGHHGSYGWWRHPHTTQEKKQSCDPEYKDLYRKRRGKHLPSVWDDLVRSQSRDHSWKTCTKNCHQWENKVKFHSKKMYVYKEHLEDDEEFVEE